MRTLGEAGVDLVIVSNAPRECPLCRPWEGKVLTIGGSDGARTVEAEHAIEDGRTVRAPNVNSPIGTVFSGPSVLVVEDGGGRR